jgi:hypothetical protein
VADQLMTPASALSGASLLMAAVAVPAVTAAANAIQPMLEAALSFVVNWKYLSIIWPIG